MPKWTPQRRKKQMLTLKRKRPEKEKLLMLTMQYGASGKGKTVKIPEEKLADYAKADAEATARLYNFESIPRDSEIENEKLREEVKTLLNANSGFQRQVEDLKHSKEVLKRMVRAIVEAV